MELTSLCGWVIRPNTRGISSAADTTTKTKCRLLQSYGSVPHGDWGAGQQLSVFWWIFNIWWWIKASINYSWRFGFSLPVFLYILYLLLLSKWFHLILIILIIIFVNSIAWVILPHCVCIRFMFCRACFFF